MTDTQTLLLTLGIFAALVLIAVLNAFWLNSKQQRLYWVIVLGVFGTASMVDSVTARAADEYSHATYSLIVAVICGYLVNKELNNHKNRNDK